jgi:gluconate kinase
LVDGLVQKKYEFIKQFQEAGIIRNRKAREFVALQSKISEVKSRATQRHLHFLSLTRQLEALSRQLHENSIMYKRMKTDQN